MTEQPTHAMVPAQTFLELRREYRERGPRHRNADRWLFDYGWTIDRATLHDYLAPEKPS